MRRLILLTTLLAAAAVVASCADSSSDREPPDLAAAATSSSVTTSTAVEEPTATVKQYAALVAEHRGDWDTQVADTEENCLDPATLPACNLGYFALKLKAETLHLILTGAHKDSHPNYLGEPPAEVAQLLDDTEAAAAAVPPAVDAYQSSGCTDPLLECPSVSMPMTMAVAELSGKLAAWSAY